jgi:hypothetical protein
MNISFSLPIDRTEFTTEMSWQAVVAFSEVSKATKRQIVEREHLMKAFC